MPVTSLSRTHPPRRRPWRNRATVSGTRSLTPTFWIVGGPNGSGKSTIIGGELLTRFTGQRLEALSPDDIVLELRASRVFRDELTLLRAAQEQSDQLVEAAISARRTIMVETVLSSPKFQPLVDRARGSGMDFGFIYVIVESAQINIGRVADRVAHGGHDVPEDRVRERRQRSMAAMPWFAARASLGLVIENTQTPVVLAEKRRDEPGWRLHRPERLRHLGLNLDPSPPPSA